MLAPRREALLNALASGYSRSEAMRIARVSREEFYGELHRSPEFRDQVLQAADLAPHFRPPPPAPIPPRSHDSHSRGLAPIPQPLQPAPDAVAAVVLIAVPAFLAIGLMLLGVRMDSVTLGW